MTMAHQPTSEPGAPVSVASRLAREALRYQTVDQVTNWPLVANTSRGMLDYYTSLKKRSDVMRMWLTFCEGLMAMYCQLLVLPIARFPFVRTPLKITDHFCSKGARLLETAVPRLKDKAEPLAVDGELLVTLLFLPLSLCLAMARGTLQRIADKFVSVFPPLREAARDYDKKGVIGQWMTLVLMALVYLPLQFVSHPSETIQQAFSIPSRVIWAVIGWNIANAMAVLNESAEWTQWAQETVAYCFYTWLGLVIGAVEYWYYVVFKVTGLEHNLVWLLQSIREFLENSDSGIAKMIKSLGQTGVMQWLAEVFGNSELGLIKFLKSLWYGPDSREDRKRNRRVSGNRTVRISSPDEQQGRSRSPRRPGHEASTSR